LADFDEVTLLNITHSNTQITMWAIAQKLWNMLRPWKSPGTI